MTKRLLNKFIQNILWVIMGIMVTNYSVAGMYPLADTCQNPEPPVIIGTAKSICRSEVVSLTATGCAGTVVWSNGDIGNNIRVHPQRTTKYTAICQARQGCISCFADVWKVTVNTPDPPVLTASATHVCPGDAVTLTAKNCAETIRWSDQTTGPIWAGNIAQTTTFNATCEQDNCISNPSGSLPVQVSQPAVPVISTNSTEICAGQVVRLTASGCVGKVRWSDGGEGVVHSVTPYETTTFRAVCEIGSCRSDSSEAKSITVRSFDQKLALVSTITNGCPFQTADLSKAINNTNLNPGIRYEFRTGPSLSSSPVQSPGAVLAGIYYIFGRTTDGCYTNPIGVTVTILPCQNAIPPCLSDPATVAIRLDTLEWSKGVVCLQGRLGGSATQASWQSSGNGLFTDAGLKARYLLSETDRQRGNATFTLNSPDPDGSGPCMGASAQIAVVAPVVSRAIVGLSKKVSEPVWIEEGAARLVEVTYQLTAVNGGKRALTQLQVSDDLDLVFTAMGAGIRSVQVRADSGLVVNPAYTGRGADTTLLTKDSQLASGRKGTVWLTVRADVSQATTLTFINKAHVQALDANEGICRDWSTNGISPDPDENGDPTDNDEPTSVTVHSLRPEANETVFIPEGFSPNTDGINDRFVIRRVPPGITVQLAIYNRWGSLVYQSNEYKNDWDGTANMGIKTADNRQGLPDGTYYYQIRMSDGREFVRFLTLAR
jgi:gliding motility-associated-like protein